MADAVPRARTERRAVLDPDAGPLVFDIGAAVLRRGDDEVHLTQTEFRLLSVLADNAGRVLSRVALLQHVWDQGFFGDERIVDVHVRRLRKKLEADAGQSADPGHGARSGLPPRRRVRPDETARTALVGHRRASPWAPWSCRSLSRWARTSRPVSSLIDQRERTATRQAFIDAALVRDGLQTPGAQVSDVLGSVSPPAGTVALRPPRR